TEDLVDLIADIKPTIPRYCRVNRIIRDIPSTNVVAGNKRTSLRQDVQQKLAERGTACLCIRCREVRSQQVIASTLTREDLVYTTGTSEEHFLAFNTPNDQLAGFLRLSLPNPDAIHTDMGDLDGAAIIREVHVYGQSLPVGSEANGAAQHSGLGTLLLDWSAALASERGYARIAVISAVGTRRYYLDRGFERGELYLVKQLK
ncbi:MAG TPA: tRNA uridine(34) 5-carboxymethylaminomethyl modification radical SAM/GNAT enzyme Elp3, partial [Anaerolineales bacterium]|nr:tRNA uridine(34) 5-carboxymethylaminomethyl modification radical SAM/GNAT enzyme Elp3 [Anaerolineales bacterium]